LISRLDLSSVEISLSEKYDWLIDLT
jgi:hypothetical protein